MTYANRGMISENIIELTCKQYEDRGLAVIRKVPTPVKVVSNKKGRVSGFYEKKSTVDFDGVLSSGRFIAFDSKETRLKSLPLENIHQHQLDYMEKVSGMNGIAFLIVYFHHIDTYYRLDIKTLLGYVESPWKNKQDKPLKSIPIKFFETYATKIKSNNGLYLDFLKGV